MSIFFFFFFEFEDSFLFSNFRPEVPFHNNSVNEENYREERNNDEEQFKEYRNGVIVRIYFIKDERVVEDEIYANQDNDQDKNNFH